MIEELYLKPSRLDHSDAAEICQIDETLIGKIISGEEKIGYELAFKLAKGFNTTHSFWLNIQEDFDRADKGGSV